MNFNLANWEEHPTDNRYFIFRFVKEPQAKHFEELLKKNELPFEMHREEEFELFAVNRSDFDKARKLNYLVMAAHREPMIANAYLRYGLVLLVLVAVTIAIIGYYRNTAIG